MVNVENRSIDFKQGLNKLGFVNDDALFLVDAIPDDIDALFHIYTAQNFGATAVYLRKQLNGSYKSQIYIYDETDKNFSDRQESKLAEIQKKLWTSGEVPLACFFYKTKVTILDCTKHITDEYKPEYLVKSLKLAGKAHDLYNEQFAVKIKSGVFWDEEKNQKKFKFQNSAYDKLMENIKFVENKLVENFKDIPDPKIITKIIVQSILIKYLEERIDSNGNKLLSEKYFQKYNNALTFGDVLRNGKFIELPLF